MVNNKEKMLQSIKKEIHSLNKAETRLIKSSQTEPSKYKERIQSKIPPKVMVTLEKAFSQAFNIVFKKGVTIIEKGYNKEEISQDHDIQEYAIGLKCSRKELKKIKKSAQKANLKNASITTVEGIGLGALGIGLPDIVLFIGVILKGIYEAALHYGYDYKSNSERYFILKLMSTSLSKGEDWICGNDQVDQMLSELPNVDESMLKNQISDTSKVFAMDMLVLKFIQGLPIVGIVGGAFNPIYYNKIMRYVHIKYYKRYLNDKLRELKGY